ncbi:hypothetical protein DFH07DRAFT_739807 [Mycena maculata]|uniref:RNB domain-containing protein n=1 Tax=Mycena maculata TaxID=230809 RepID=A0AAD7JCJ5_9AGAR|nr:hypothetical protein DFH07DRAFT_739807 [Mycena maculata]
MISTIKHDVRAPSMDKFSFEAAEERASPGGDWGEEDVSGEGFIPGTFIELRRNELSTHGVVLGELFRDSRWHVMTLVSTGEVWDPLRDDVMFSVPALVPLELAQRCSMLDIAMEESQLNARIQVLQRIRQIERAVEGAVGDLMRTGTDIYNIVRSKDPDKWTSTTVTEVARLFSKRPATLVTLFAAHKYLMERPECFVAHHAYRRSQTFDVRPASHLQILKTITDWCRQRDGPLQDFARRALPVIAANRKLQAETRHDPPSQRSAKHEWTPEDITILTFLHHALQPYRSVQPDPYSIGQSSIMRQLDPDPKVDDHKVHMALIDLGVYAPWQDIFSLRRILNLDQGDPETSPEIQATDALVKRSLSTPAKSGPLGPEDFYASDPLDHLRHDFGDMPIYVIDDVGAHELDDGMSYEAIPGEPDSYWLHAHVADPASTIPPTHILAQRAAKQSQTVYFVHRTWPLFPKSLMFSGQPGFSLARKTENRVLTFSSKINAAGELVDWVVRPGIARNFIQLSYDEVDLTLTGNIIRRFYPFSPPRASPPDPQLPDWQVNDLRTLSMLRDRVVKNRFDQGIVESDNEAVSFDKFVVPSNIESPTMRASEFRGFPEFTYYVSYMKDHTASARGMVAEGMKLACRTASRWCAERGVDILRRTATPLEAAPEAMEKLRAMRDRGGLVNSGKIMALATSMPIADYSLSPVAHWALGVPEGYGYSRVTSPLRRFSDLMGHYQIHSSLLGQKPHFSTQYMQEYMEWLKADDRLKKRSENLHTRSWVLIALKRWMESPRTDIPDPLADLQAVLRHPPRTNIVTGDAQSEVNIPVLGISATLALSQDQFAKMKWQISDSMRVNIKALNLGVRPALMVTPH